MQDDDERDWYLRRDEREAEARRNEERLREQMEYEALIQSEGGEGDETPGLGPRVNAGRRR